MGEREGVIGEERKRNRKRKEKIVDEEKREESRVVVGSMAPGVGRLDPIPALHCLCGLRASPFSSV